MFRWLKRLLFGAAAARPADPLALARQKLGAILAKYDAAQTTDENKRHWANADGLSAAAANSPQVRFALRTRSRYEYDNNGYCAGIVRQLADDLVGTGPTLQILTEDDEVADQIEAAWNAWAKSIGLAEKLHTALQARVRDGETFLVMTNNPRADSGGVNLAVEIVECDRVADPRLTSGFQFAALNTGDGIEYDADGNPVSYTVLSEHPGDALLTFPIPSVTYAASQVIHWFRRHRPGQLRGVPELQSSLPLFAQLRRWTLATLSAAEIAACFAAMLESEASADGATPEGTPFDTLEIVRGMMTQLPGGMKANQFKAEQPTTTYPDFKWEIVKEAGRPVSMPGNIAAGDSSRHNFSSAKLDHFGYRGSLRVDRSFADLNVLERLFMAWFAEARLIPGLLPAGLDLMTLPRKWQWPGWPSMDKDEAKNDTERLNNGTDTLSSILGEWGVDWKEALRQRGRELAYAAEQGVTPAPTVPPDGAPADAPADAPAEDAPAAAASRIPSLNGNGRHK